MEPQQRPTDEVHLLFLPLPEMGHLLPMVELAKRLLNHHPRFTITFLCIPPQPPYPQISAYISSVAASGLPISFHDLSAVDPPALDDQSPEPEAFISAYAELYRPVVKTAIETIMGTSPAPVAAVVLDLFCTAMIDVVNELGAAPYLFYVTGASTLGFMMHLPTLDAAIPDDKTFDEMEGKAFQIPGFSSVFPVRSLPNPISNLKGEGYKWFIRHGIRYLDAKGIIINSFAELQPHAIMALEEGLYIPDIPTPPVYPVGPILSIEPKEAMGGGAKHECVRWLDEQPQGSVLFICFGSLGKLQTDQVREIAAGLERSGHRFLWVLRRPVGQQEQGSHTRPTDAVLDEVLPDGFLERTKSRGLVWPSFAPQREILTHDAVGGFVSHCGWNSTLESLWCGVPMAAWPLYAEQHLTAFELTREIGVAVEVRINRKGGNSAGADEVERAVRCLMGEEGREVRKKTKEMKEKARKAVQEGGSSFLSMKRLAEEMIRGASKP